MVEVVARHNIVVGGVKKGQRQTIKAGMRFNTDDFDMISEDEWKAMAQNGNIAPPDQTSYATPALMQAQRASATEPVTEGRSQRTDIGSNRPAETVGGITRPTQTEDNDDDDDDEDTPPARRGRRGRRRATTEDNEV